MFSDVSVDMAALSRVVAASRLVAILGGPSTADQRQENWQQLDALLARDGSDEVVSTIAFGLRQTHDIPDGVLLSLGKNSEAAAVLFDEAEGISAPQWQRLERAAPHLMASQQRRQKIQNQRFDKLRMNGLDRSETELGGGYAQLKTALTELHDGNRLTNGLLGEIVGIWGLGCVIGALVLRSGLRETQVLAQMRDETMRQSLFARCQFDATLIAKIRLALQATHQKSYARFMR